MPRLLAIYITILLFISGLNPVRIESRDLNLITSSSTPPYIFAKEDSGIVIDIIRKAFEVKGHIAAFKYAPNLRVMAELEKKSVDGAFNVPGAKSVYFSDPVIEYRDVIVSLKRRKLKIRNVSDLLHLRVVAFQNASNFLGTEYAEMTKGNDKYREVPHQSSQIPMLFLNRADVIVLEEGIFYYYLSHSKVKFNKSEKYVIHDVFKKSPQYAAFINEHIRDDFNYGLRYIRKSGEYNRIVESYTMRMNVNK